jgi:cobalt-zinc-cadmium efflux system membrane fusion protein
MKAIKYMIFGSLLIAACSGEKDGNQTVNPSTGAPSDNTVTLTLQQAATIKLETNTLVRRSLSTEIKANGYLGVPPENNAMISPMISGYVRKVNFLVGNDVKKGQVMAELESMEFIDLQQKYIELQARIDYLKEEYKRQKLLMDQDAVSRKQYLKADVDYRTAASEMEGLRSKLELLGADFQSLESGKIASRLLVKAPISGSVKALSIMIGKFVSPAEEIFEIVNTDHLHLELSVFENDITKVEKGQKVWFVVPSIRNQAYEGEVFLVGKDLSEDKRSINVHVHIEESDAPFAVGMYANASIAVDSKPSFTLPVAAVVVDNENKYVFKKTNETNKGVTFEMIRVETGLEKDGLVEIAGMNGILPEDEVVIRGAFYLLNAFSIGEN